MDEPPPPTNAPLLEYATPQVPTTAGDPLLRGMRVWRRCVAWGIVASVVSAVVFLPVLLLSIPFTLLAAAMTLDHMTRYAASNFGVGYAVRHLVMAIVLAPLLFLGVFLVSFLVQADIERWHQNAERSRS